ncbi:GNAT family N-acetyltransferase [Aquipuribacter sp. SD81]|uniref:GNAT family N-acetyltransferase n=1 Tax=Aquipuribacter sp. SD81 TaxID=3127703 RepID=UPI00301B10EC
MTTLPTGLTISSPDVEDVEQLASWRRGFTDVFGMPGSTPEETRAAQVPYREQRLTGVRDGGRWVATFRSWAGTSAVPGGAATGHDDADVRSVDSELVSSVAVGPTHRRRGVLTALMADCLHHARERGAVLATLFASEVPIYGRFGYGVATEVADLRLDPRAVRLRPRPDAGRVRLSDDDELLRVGPDLFEAARLRMPGAVGRNEMSWQRLAERLPSPGADAPAPPRLQLVHEAADGTVDGYARVRLEGKWDDEGPANTATVDDLTALRPEAAAALWRTVLDLDLVRTVSVGHRTPHDLLRTLVGDLRVVRTTVHDGHWWRVLDPVRLLTARRWGAPGRSVLEVHDPDGPAGGRWLLDVDETGEATVTPSTASADLTLPVQVLPAVVCGVRALGPLAAAGDLQEETPGAVARLERTARVGPVALAAVQGF